MIVEVERAEETWTSFLERFPDLARQVDNTDHIAQSIKVFGYKVPQDVFRVYL